MADGHGHDDFPVDESESPLCDSERLELTSVGIDIGSATTNVVFSRIELRRQGSELSSRYVPVSREVVHAAAPRLTPYASGLNIDEVALAVIIDDAFDAAGVTAAEIDTGAVLLTGEATRRRNAAAIGELFARRSGSFVCAMAGHELEAELAAHGSGAVALSREKGIRLCNVDIGGGTTKFTVIDHGEIVSTAALHVGGRLVAHENDVISRVEPIAQQIAATLGHTWQVGTPVDDADLAEVAEYLVAAVIDVANGRQPVGPPLLFGEPVAAEGVERVVLSGGVAEYLVAGADVDDLGCHLAATLTRRAGDLPAPLETAARRISATVVGASQYTVQVSGNTIHLSDGDLLPLNNLRTVLLPTLPEGDIDAAAVADAIGTGLRKARIGVDEDVAVAFTWAGPPSFRRMDTFLSGVQRGLADRTAAGRATCLVMDGDVGRSLGRLLTGERGHRVPVISIDGVTLADFDFVDIGTLMPKTGTVPLSVKTMLYHL